MRPLLFNCRHFYLIENFPNCIFVSVLSAFQFSSVSFLLWLPHVCTGQLACLNVKTRGSRSVHFCFDHDFSTSLLSEWFFCCLHLREAVLLQVRGFQPHFSQPNCFCLLLLNNSEEVSVCKASFSHLKQRGVAFILHPDSVVLVEV